MVVCDVNDALGETVVREIETAGGSARYRHLDVVDEAAWETLIDEVVADTAFLNFADRIVGGYPFYSGDAVDRAFGESTRMPDAARTWLLDFLRRKFDVAI